jgi:hypothetical protein
MVHVNGEMVTYGDGALRLFFYATELFGDFDLRLQFRIFDAANHNSGVFVRFPRPSLDLSEDVKAAHRGGVIFRRGESCMETSHLRVRGTDRRQRPWRFEQGLLRYPA